MPLVVKDGKILSSGVAIGSTDWQVFLSSSRSFRYESASYGGYTATKQGEYWYASRKYQGTLYRKYVGATKELNVELLEAAAIALTEMTSNHQKLDNKQPEQNNGELHKRVEYLTDKVEQMEGELRTVREELNQVTHVDAERRAGLKTYTSNVGASTYSPEACPPLQDQSSIKNSSLIAISEAVRQNEQQEQAVSLTNLDMQLLIEKRDRILKNWRVAKAPEKKERIQEALDRFIEEIVNPSNS